VFAVVLLYRRGARRSVLAVAAAFALALAVEGVLKLLLHHPDVPNPLSPPSAPLPPNSFPSGHVLRASVLATAATFLWPRQSVRVAALVIVALVAYTRIYTGAHWTSDVLAALLLGWALHVGSAAYAHVADQSQRPTCAPV
jgi:undecaprenyl-diphosphatase